MSSAPGNQYSHANDLGYKQTEPFRTKIECGFQRIRDGHRRAGCTDQGAQTSLCVELVRHLPSSAHSVVTS